MLGFLMENAKLLLGLIRPKNITGAAQNTPYINLGAGRRLLLSFTGGAWAGGTAAVTLTQATDNAGTGAKTLAFTRAWTFNGAVGDAPTEVAVTNNSVDLANLANQSLVVEVHQQDLDLSNGYKWVRGNVASPGANNDFLTCNGILYELPYSAKPSTLPSAL